MGETKGNYNVTMTSGTDADGKNYVVAKIHDIDWDNGPSSTGKTLLVAHGKVYFKDDKYRNVTVQLTSWKQR